MDIQIISSTGSDWQQLVDSYESDVFHSPGWVKVLANTYGFDPKAYVLLGDNGEPLAGIPFCEIEDIRGKRIVSLPFSDYCDPLVKSDAQWKILFRQMLESNVLVKIRCLHNEDPLRDERLEEVNKAKWHGIDLDRELDVIWDGLESAARRAIRKAKKEGVEGRIAQSKDELRAFFEMHLKVRKYKYRLVAQPYLFFENIWEEFMRKDKGALMLARYEGEIVGGVVSEVPEPPFQPAARATVIQKALATLITPWAVPRWPPSVSSVFS